MGEKSRDNFRIAWCIRSGKCANYRKLCYLCLGYSHFVNKKEAENEVY